MLKNKVDAIMQLQSDNNSPGHSLKHTHEITLLGYIELLLKYKKMIGTFAGIAFIFSVVVSILLPVRYTAVARILPPNESGGSMSTLLTQAEGVFGGLAGNLMGGQTQSELYVGIMKSRTVADALIQRFELKNRYDLAYIEDVYAKLAERTHFNVDNKSQIITVAFEDGEPQRSADIANAYVDELDRINRTLNITEGQKKRQFLEERLTKVQSDLAKAETALKEFQERHKLVSIEEQAKATIEVAAAIKGEIITAQTKLEIQRQFGTQRQNEAVMLVTEIEELQRQLDKLEIGRAAKTPKDQDDLANESNLFIPIGNMPDLGLKLVRLTREAKIQEKVFELMTTQLELAKMEEAKDVNVIQVLDRASPPEKRSYPQRRFLVLLSTIVALFCGAVMAFFIDYWSRLQLCRPDLWGSIKAHLHFSGWPWRKI
jgi:uncharacterized protein involved in exopolysaccharide biosynthesis